jgi:methionine-rich copper-binding protein CopC
MNSRFLIRSIARLGVVAGALAVAIQAQAHAHLIASAPAKDATVAAPTLLTLHFSEKLEAKFSGVELDRSDGTQVPVTSAVPDNDPKTILGRVAGRLPPGAYTVKWHNVSADTHRMEGSYSFTVR